MTDKQIIKDNIDISKCKHYDEEFDYCDQSYLGEGGLLKNTKNPKRCEYSPNCYYKQLKRKEQECDMLKKEKAEIKKYLGISHKTILERLEELTDFRDKDREELDQLKVENEELKKEKRNFYNFLTNKYNYGSFKPMWGAYLLKRFFNEDLNDFFNEEAYKMVDTIEEKEKQLDRYSQTLAEIKEIAETCSFVDSSELLLKRIKLILQKISEVNNAK